MGDLYAAQTVGVGFHWFRVKARVDPIYPNPPPVFSHEGAQGKKEYPNLPNEKFLGVQKGLAAPAY